MNWWYWLVGSWAILVLVVGFAIGYNYRNLVESVRELKKWYMREDDKVTQNPTVIVDPDSAENMIQRENEEKIRMLNPEEDDLL